MKTDLHNPLTKELLDQYIQGFDAGVDHTLYSLLAMFKHRPAEDLYEFIMRLDTKNELPN